MGGNRKVTIMMILRIGMIIMIITTMKRNDDDDNGNNGDVDASPRRGATTKSVVAHKEKPPQALGKIATHQEAARVLEKTNISKYLYQL